MRRLYAFIVLGVVLENAWLLWRWSGCNDEQCCSINDTCMMLSTGMWALFAMVSSLYPMSMLGFSRKRRMWFYCVPGLYMIYQIADASQMYSNGNISNPTIEFVSFIVLNIAMWLYFRNK